MAQNAFVTGGTGFIGLNLIQELVNSGWAVTALHREASELTYLNRFPVQLAPGTLTDIDSLRRALPADTDVVFHVAGDTNFWSKLNDRQTAVNVTGTDNMVRVAKEKGVSCFIHTSSISAWGDVSGLISEATPQLGKDSWINYESSKWAGAQVALQAGDDEMKVVVLCPGAVMGPYDTTSWGRIFFVLRDGEFPFSPPGAISVAHVREVVQAHVTAVENGRPGATYIVAGHDTTLPAVMAEISRCLGLEPRPTIPGFLLRMMGRLAVIGAGITGRPPLMTPEMAASFSRSSATFSSDLAVSELGYELVPLQACVRDCYEWLMAEDLL